MNSAAPASTPHPDKVLGTTTYRRQWLNSHNRTLNGVPRELLAQPAGLVDVVQYLRSLRSQL